MGDSDRDRETELLKRIAELEAQAEVLVRQGARDKRTIAQLERKLAQLDKMHSASETVNVTLYSDMKRLTGELVGQTRRVNELLLNVLPSAIKEELESTGRVSSRMYESATVLFSDFVGFTSFSENRTAEEVVERLNRYFTAFDEVTASLGVEKLKTVGDGYMCVAGVPVTLPAHAFQGVLAGIEIVRATCRINESYRAAGQPWLGIRVGIHSGPVVAGVIGSRKFAFDIWGDTVNTAARIEAAGTPDAVTISSTTYEHVRSEVRCEPMGLVSAKGKAHGIEIYRVLDVDSDEGGGVD